MLNVGIGVGCGRKTFVSHPVLHFFECRTFFEEQSGIGVTQVVETDFPLLEVWNDFSFDGQLVLVVGRFCDGLPDGYVKDFHGLYRYVSRVRFFMCLPCL